MKHGRRARVLCLCDCGTEKIILKQNLVNGTTKSCGCLNAPVIPSGTKFNRWTVVEKVKVKEGWKYRCRCSCGTEKLVSGVSIKRGISKSCGCYAFEVKSLPQGEAMFNCTLDNYKNNARKRGFGFDLQRKEARELFQSVCSYCGTPPSSVTRGHRFRSGAFTYNGIDRKDNNKGYTKDNCVTCCATCNHHKRMLSVDEFFSWVDRLLKPEHRSKLNCLELTELQIRQQMSVYRRSARLRGISFSLESGQCRQLFQSSCAYCGAVPSNQRKTKDGFFYIYGGIDRVDNNVGYTPDNCVPCCWHCNWAKSKGTVEDLMKWARRVKSSSQSR